MTEPSSASPLQTADCLRPCEVSGLKARVGTSGPLRIINTAACRRKKLIHLHCYKSESIVVVGGVGGVAVVLVMFVVVAVVFAVLTATIPRMITIAPCSLVPLL